MIGCMRPGEWLDYAVQIHTDDCIRWPYGLTSVGYPSGAAHVVVCERCAGPRPEGMEAAHSCGHAWCVNPRHLEWKSPRANTFDRIAHGSRSPLIPPDFDDDPVKAAIRRRYVDGDMTQQQLAVEYGISQSTVSRYLHGYSYSR